MYLAFEQFRTVKGVHSVRYSFKMHNFTPYVLLFTTCLMTIDRLVDGSCTHPFVMRIPSSSNVAPKATAVLFAAHGDEVGVDPIRRSLFSPVTLLEFRKIKRRKKPRV